MENFSSIISLTSSYLWGIPLLLFLFGTHLFLTFRTKFIQKKIFLGIKLSFKNDSNGQGDVSPFEALSTALAATIGIGNIIGVGTAIALGGPGAVLWMWLAGILGIATMYAESFIAIKYRVRTQRGTMLGGAMYALERGLKMKWLGILFALFAGIASFGVGSSIQSGAIAVSLNESMNIPYWISGLVITIFVAMPVIGGIKSISKACVKLVPFMTLIYLIGCLVILITNANYIMPAISEIVRSAFHPRAAGGGFIAAGIMAAARFGIARGLFSNEAGLGSSPIAAAAAKTKNPFRQALIASTGTFWDTVIVCAVTGLVLVSGVLANPAAVDIASIKGSSLVYIIFWQVKYIGPVILTFGLITFAFSTILGWAYYGERCFEYLFGIKSNVPYRVIFVIVTFLGAITSLNILWDLADIFNALMAIPNLVAVLLLSGFIARETKYYLTGDNINKVDETPIPLYGQEETTRKKYKIEI